MNRKKLIKVVISLILGIFLVNFLANKFYWYSTIWYFDMIMHFLGGLWIGLIFIYAFPPKDHSMSFILRTMLFVLFIGVSWELYEVLVNGVLAKDVFNSLDTISDIFFDLAGGFLAVLYFLRKIVLTSQNEVQLNNV